MFVLMLFVILLCVASLWSNDLNYVRKYPAYIRWIGPWDNPNIFGVLMGTGIVLVFGVFRLVFLGESHSNLRRISREQIAIVCLSILAAGLMGRAWLHSYSRKDNIQIVSTPLILEYQSCVSLMF